MQVTHKIDAFTFVTMVEVYIYIYMCNTQETDKKVEWTFQDWCAILPL